jgi:hypothetical protein
LIVSTKRGLPERVEGDQSVEMPTLVCQIENRQRADGQQATCLRCGAASPFIHQHDGDVFFDGEADGFVFAMAELDAAVHLCHFHDSKPVGQMVQPCRDCGRCFGMAKLFDHCLRNHHLAKQ